MFAADHIFRHYSAPKIIFFIFLLSIISPAKSDDLQILLKFKSAFEKSNSQAFNTWNSTNNMCDFTGISCHSDGFVKEIRLPEKKLSGAVPFDSICELQWLDTIDFGSNFIYGGVDYLKNCTRLEYLDLGVNSFTGEFKMPDLISSSQLKFLNLNASGFSGVFPWKSLQNLTKLAFLSLGDNQLDANPFPVEVMNLENLYWLYLSNCSIEGRVPLGIGNLTKLQNLELSDNKLYGEIPSDIGKLVNLWQLELYDNQFSGKLPIGFGNLTNLVNFDASSNQLEGNLSELRFLSQLASLQLFENEFTGEVPIEFGDFIQLAEISLYSNKFSGILPKMMGSSADFNYIDVSDNLFSGPIPPYMCEKGKMTDLFILDNQFTGEIPETYANCTSLVRFRVNNNSLTGSVPAGLWSLPNLTIIDLTSNQFHGSITSDIAAAESLAQLFISNNQFSGEIPGKISEVSSLVAVDLSFNRFSGEIPAKIGELKKLSSLHLEENLFSGSIPVTIGYCVSLTDLNLAGNSFSGAIPPSFGSLPSLNSLNLSDNMLSNVIPTSFSSLKLSLLDLSNNKLTGEIPESLSAYNASFTGNSGLCSQIIANIHPCSSNSNDHDNNTFLYCFVAGTAVLLMVVTCFAWAKLKESNHSRSISQRSWDMKLYKVLNFTESEIVNSITEENLIGKGGSGHVYKVVLKSGKEVAVKHIQRTAMRRQEYEAEVAALSSIRHVNVVELYCSVTCEDSNLLVYDYMRNGSLWDQLHTCRKMEMGWEVRYGIAVGSAKGLEYLHHGCDRAVVHRDVKSSNILLDESMKPRIADFGLAKILDVDTLGLNSSNMFAGTHGYMAPEYAYSCKITEKSDVYSFGVVLLELVTGKRPIEPEFGENKDIVHWVCNKIRVNENMVNVVDSSISDPLKEDAIKVLKLAIHCVARIPVLRPTMRTVVHMLEEVEPYRLTNVVFGK